MARFKRYDMNQTKMIPVSYADQVLEGSFEHALNEIVEDGPDVRLWVIRTKGSDLSLVYSDFPNGISIEPRDTTSDALIRHLFWTFEAQTSPDGL